MRYALFIDLNALNLSYESFLNAIKQLDGDVVYSKFYGFNQKRHSAFNKYIKDNSSDIALTLQNRKKVKIDIRQVIDVCMSCSSSFDAYFLICSELDAIYLVKALKNAGKKVLIGVYSKNALCDEVDGYIELERYLEKDNVIPYTSIVCKSEEEKKIIKNIQSIVSQKKTPKYTLGSTKEIDKLLEKYF